MSSREKIQRLIAVLQERGISVKRDDVAGIFESPKTKDAAVEWVEEYIGSSTLLSRDELELYRSLGGRVGPIANPSRPIRDSDIDASITALKASTAAIERHCKTLEAQRDALQELLEQNVTKGGAFDADIRLRGQRLHESTKLGFTIEELQQILEAELRDADGETERAIDDLSNATKDGLNSHDKVLDAVSKLAPKTEISVKHSVDPKTIDQWCRALVSLREQEVKARIDSVLFNGLVEQAEELQNGDSVEGSAEHDEIQAELKSLHDEITSVAEVVIAHEVRQPLLRYMRASTVQAKETQKDWSEYILSTMQHMIHQLDILQEHGNELHGFDSALEEVQIAFNETTAPSASGASTAKTESVTPSTPTKGVVSRVKDRSVDQALRRFNITPGKDSSATLSALLDAVASSHAKLQDQYDTAETLELEALGQSLEARDQDLHALLSRLYGNSQFNTIRLTDKSLDAQLQSLDEKIADTAAEYAKADHDRRHDTLPANVEKLKAQYC